MRFDPLPINRMTTAAICLLPPTEIEVPGCLTYTNIPDFGWEFGNRLLSTLYQPRICRLASVELRRFPPDARVAVPSDEEFLPLCGAHVAAEHIHPAWPDEQLQSALAACEVTDFIDESTVVIGRFGMRTWGHWLGELLPKMICVEALHPGRYKYLLPDRLMTDPVLKSQRESLEFYGLVPDRLLLVQPGRSYRFREMTAVTSAWSDRMIHPGAVELMRGHERIPAETAKTPDRHIALLRRESNTRNLDNSDEIECFLRSHDWSVIDVGNVPFAEQVAEFEAASAIVSVLGSGLTGTIYAPRGVKVLTLAPVGWADGFFFALLQNRNAMLADIRGLKSPDDPRPVASSRFHVNVEDIERGLRGLNLIPNRP
ncbi:MAG: glycosyltransferase family 61 protein [Acetobacteraceae bacterium]